METLILSNIICLIQKRMKKIVVLWSFFSVIVAQDQCLTPSGGAGVCVHASDCRPLLELNEKAAKTPEELNHLTRSVCGSQVKLKYCCPPDSELTESAIAERKLSPTYPTTFAPALTTLQINDRRTTSKHKYNQVTGSMTEDTEIPLSIGICPQSLKPPAYQSLCCGIEIGYSAVINRHEVAGGEQFPWLALLEYGTAVHCGGALMSSRYVLTAAHCLEGQYGNPTRVRLSEYNTTSFPKDKVDNGAGFDTLTNVVIGVEISIQHPGFKKDSYENDIGLVKMKHFAPYTDNIYPICLPNKDITRSKRRETFFVAGWGTETDFRSEIKRWSKLPLVPRDRCQIPGASQGVFFAERKNYLCAGGEREVDRCIGDSGGPLTYENGGDIFTIAGITSFGNSYCGTGGSPTVYTNVFQYIDWILKETV